MKMTLGLGLLVLAAMAVIVLFSTGVIGGNRSVDPAAGSSTQARKSTGQPIPGGRAKVVVRGWSPSEARTILDDFAKVYELEPANFRLSAASDGGLIVELPKGLPDDRFLYLVNYLNYPDNFDLTRRKLAICGIWQIEDGAQVGSRAVVYIPQSDTEYDQAYVQMDRQQAYKVSFTDMTWVPTTDRRLPPEVADLEQSIP